MNIDSPLSLLGIGLLFCIGGVYLFYRNAFEEDKKITQPVLVITAGVVLIGLAMAKFYHVIK